MSEPDIPSIPWELGIHDAHCHPTDTMSSIPSIPAMKAATLTIMSTRDSDQRLVSSVAATSPKVVPSFGHHPWFSHLLWDDISDPPAAAAAAADDDALKQRHYSQVLVPVPDADFIAQLHTPRRLSDALAEMRAHLTQFPHALVGEIGMDRGFRLLHPDSTADHRRLSHHRVAIPHQKRIFKAQLQLAGSLQRAVSVHGVQCHGLLYDTFREVWAGHLLPRERRKDQKRRRRKAPGGGHEYLPDRDPDSDSDSDSDPGPGLEAGQRQQGRGEVSEKPFPPRICLHSFSAPLETLKQYLTPPSATTLFPSRVFFSFSTTINARPQKGHLAKIADTIKEVPDDAVLVESDLHTAGDQLDDALAGALLYINEVKGWELEHGVRQLGANWRSFVFGDEEEKEEGGD